MNIKEKIKEWNAAYIKTCESSEGVIQATGDLELVLHAFDILIKDKLGGNGKEDKKECFSCEKEFELEEYNDHAQGYFCEECLCNGEGY